MTTEESNLALSTMCVACGLARIDSAEQRRRAIENEARGVQEANQLGLDPREYRRCRDAQQGDDFPLVRATLGAPAI